MSRNPILRALGKMMGLTSMVVLLTTPAVYLAHPDPIIQYVVAGQLATFILSIILHGGAGFLVDAALGEDSGRGEYRVPDDPTDLLGDGGGDD